MTSPWQLTVSVIIGLWLMISPSVFQIGIETSAANLNHLGGALVIVFAVVAMAEVLRSFRYFNVLLGLALAVMPWMIADSSMAYTLSSSLAGLLVIALSFAKGEIKEKYGLWDKYIV
jgi:hypothetical protein